MDIGRAVLQGYAAWIVGLLAVVAIASVCVVRARRFRRRERLAQDVQDALLQNTQGLLLKFHGIAGQMPSGDPSRERMEQVLETADKLIAEDLDRVENLRSQEHLAAHEPLPNLFGRIVLWLGSRLR